jgi:hypothetical protein
MPIDQTAECIRVAPDSKLGEFGVFYVRITQRRLRALRSLICMKIRPLGRSG